MSGASPRATASPPVAAFDFDGTLLAGDTLLILHRLVRSPLGQLIDGLLLLPALLLWKSGQRSTAWFKQVVLQRLLTPPLRAVESGHLVNVLLQLLPLVALAKRALGSKPF